MELLFQGGRVLTMDPLNRIASGVAVRDGRIVAVGSSAEVANAVGPTATVVPLNGRALTPGFIDCRTGEFLDRGQAFRRFLNEAGRTRGYGVADSSDFGCIRRAKRERNTSK